MSLNITTLLKKYSLLVFFIIIIIFALNTGINYEEIASVFKKLSLKSLTLLIFAFLGISVTNIFIKKVILFFLGHNVKTKNITLIHFASVSAHYSTPVKIGYPVTVFLLKKLENIPYVIATTSLVLELFTTLFLSGLITTIGFFLYFEKYLKLDTKTVVFGIMFIILCYLLTFLLKKLKPEWSKNLNQAIKEISKKKLFIYFILQMLQLIAGAGFLKLVLYSFDQYISLWDALISNSSAFFVGAFSMIPMGIGSRDLTLLYYLKHFGVVDSISISVASVQRVISTGLGYFLGLLSSSFLGISQWNQNKSKNRK
ncbi:flippase-like domain-containing protein [bacterium]|nr:flippase-like domain-containing protein [bacterium]